VSKSSSASSAVAPGALSKDAILRALLPNRAIHPVTALAIVGFWVATALVVWVGSPFETLPTPRDIWTALGSMWWEHGMGPELFSTLKLITESLLLTVAISLALSYVSVIAFLRPVVAAVSKLRFLGLTGLVFPFMLFTGGGYALKVALLTFGMTTFFVTSMAQAVLEIPQSAFDHMRVLGAGELRIVWEVVVRGTLDRALDVLRQNAAMGWAMITMVEGISRAEGGIGALILNQNKHFRLAEVYAILLVILLLGLAMDWLMRVLTDLLCPYSRMGMVKR
jgi:NitT/TauT family transport system permease protein